MRVLVLFPLILLCAMRVIQVLVPLLALPVERMLKPLS